MRIKFHNFRNNKDCKIIAKIVKHSCKCVIHVGVSELIQLNRNNFRSAGWLLRETENVFFL